MPQLKYLTETHKEKKNSLGMKIGILGGGLSGLALGYELQKSISKEDVIVIEKNNEAAGLLRSDVVKGYTFDVGGSHIIFSKNKMVLEEMVSLLGNNITKRRRNTKILYKGRLVKYPFENGLSDLPLEDNYECLYYFIENYIKRVKGELKTPKNMKEWFYYTFGKGIAEKYLLPYNEKIWKYPLDRMSTEWVERIPFPPLSDIIKSSLGIPTEGYTHQLYFYYPLKGGIQELARELSKRNTVITDAEITRVIREGDKWVVNTTRGSYRFDRVVSTLPLPELARVYEMPEETAKKISRLKYNSLVTVGIGLNKPPFNDLSWLYVPDRDIIFHRVSFPFNYSPYVTPKGKSSMLVEITYKDESDIAKMSDNDISERVVEDVEKLGLTKKEEIEVTHVARFKYAYVLYDIEYRKIIGEITGTLEKEGLMLFGRFSRWEYLNMDHIMEKAQKFAKILLS